MLKKTPLKRNSFLKPGKGLKRGPIKRQSDKWKEGKEVRIEHGKAMMDLFEKHWTTHPDKRCEGCGKQLYGENNTMYHDHALQKSTHPEAALMIECLVLVCPECHSNRHAGIVGEKYQSALSEAIDLTLIKLRFK